GRAGGVRGGAAGSAVAPADLDVAALDPARRHGPGARAVPLARARAARVQAADAPGLGARGRRGRSSGGRGPAQRAGAPRRGTPPGHRTSLPAGGLRPADRRAAGRFPRPSRSDRGAALMPVTVIARPTLQDRRLALVLAEDRIGHYPEFRRFFSRVFDLDRVGLAEPGYVQ